MNKKEAIALMRNEKNCVLKADTCDKDCAKCELVRKTEDLLSAYDLTIQGPLHKYWMDSNRQLICHRN